MNANSEKKQNQEKILFMLNGLSIPKLKEIVQLAYKSNQLGSGMIFFLASNVLEEKIPEPEYLAFINVLG